MGSTTNPAVSRKSTRNESMECCKFIAAFFIVSLHAPLPGTFGKILNALAGFAVPTFFMITGYFNYRATSSQLCRRIWHIVKLLLIATCVHLVYGCVATEIQGGSTIAYLRAAVPDPIEILQFFVHHIHPYAGHLWYLIGLIATYGVFYLFTRFGEAGQLSYRPFYTLSLCLFCLMFALDTLPSALTGETITLSTRTGWFAGIPMFGLGLFIREYQDQIFRAFSLHTGKLLGMMLLGAVLTVIQKLTTGIIGMIPFGTMILAGSLMLFLVSHPTVPVKSAWAHKLILSLGPLSTWIYLLHMAIGIFYLDFLRDSINASLGENGAYAAFAFVSVASVLAAIFCEFLSSLLRRIAVKKN